MSSQDNKRIAKNSLFLYIQMAIRMLVGLYTTRVVLHALGVVDFGINNVVGGFVSMFTFISDTMVSASQRFFAYEIGRGDKKKLNDYFNTTVLCYVLIALSMFILVEAVGIWFLNNKMVIPAERLDAANWVFQFAVLSLIFHMIAVPFSSMVVAQEKMVVFAIVGLLDAFLKLGIVYVLLNVEGDKLKWYAVMLFVIAALNYVFYHLYCHFNFKEAVRIRLFWNKPMFIELISYSGWSLFWTLANVVRSQGINILLNMFFNPVVNAARGVAYQVNSAINQFVNSFYQAVRPQITKLTARKEYDEMLRMVFSSSKISFLLMALIAIPIIVETPYILQVWLKDVPEYTVVFTRLVVITAMIDTLGLSLTTAVCSTGRIKWFHIVCGGILILNLPVSYVFLKLGFSPYAVLYVSIVMSLLAQVARVFFVHRMFGMSITKYGVDVILRITCVTLLSFAGTWAVSNVLGEGFGTLCVVLAISFGLTGVLSYFIGLSKTGRGMVKAFVVKKLKKS